MEQLGEGHVHYLSLSIYIYVYIYIYIYIYIVVRHWERDLHDEQDTVKDDSLLYNKLLNRILHRRTSTSQFLILNLSQSQLHRTVSTTTGGHTSDPRNCIFE